MLLLNSNNFENEVERSEELCVIDLYADWCMPCKMLAPILLELEGEMSNVKFCKINVDNSPELAAAFHVSSIPMVAIVKGGVFIDFSVGLVGKDVIAKLIKDNM